MNDDPRQSMKGDGDELAGVAQMLRDAGGYVEASGDLRPRVLESVRLERGVTRLLGRVHLLGSTVAMLVGLMALVSWEVGEAVAHGSSRHRLAVALADSEGSQNQSAEEDRSDRKNAERVKPRREPDRHAGPWREVDAWRRVAEERARVLAGESDALDAPVAAGVLIAEQSAAGQAIETAPVEAQPTDGDRSVSDPIDGDANNRRPTGEGASGRDETLREALEAAPPSGFESRPRRVATSWRFSPLLLNSEAQIARVARSW